MTIQQAIEKAIEGGYKKWELSDAPHLSKFHYNIAFLDPNFWMSLGKAIGWPVYTGHDDEQIPGWKEEWHRFIDHLAEGKDAESFFESL